MTLVVDADIYSHGRVIARNVNWFNHVLAGSFYGVPFFISIIHPTQINTFTIQYTDPKIYIVKVDNGHNVIFSYKSIICTGNSSPPTIQTLDGREMTVFKVRKPDIDTINLLFSTSRTEPQIELILSSTSGVHIPVSYMDNYIETVLPPITNLAGDHLYPLP